MSFKTLFDKAVQVNSLSNKSANEIGGEVESPAYHKQDIIHEKRFIPNVDFSDPANFARYGSAEEYYVQSIERVYETYPYDGSLKERLEWENDSTYIDLHLFNHLYPRTNGYIILSADGWGVGNMVDGYGSSSSPEYIFLKGGPHPNPNGMSPYSTEYTGSNYYDASANRESNLKYDLDGNGVTVEFWLQKPEFLPLLTQREVIFDLWNGELSSSTSYGRLTIELSASNDPAVLGVAPVLVTAQSGTAGFFRQSVGTTSVTTASIGDGDWHHYAISLLSSSGGIDTRFYVDGTKNNEITIGTGISEVTGALRAYIGGLITSPSGSTATAGFGKLSGSLDEFRYWKTQRSSKDVGRYFISQVGGGTNNDPEPFTDSREVVNTDLGVYYKFNEGITGIAATDSVVLDYSGRVTNGTWTGYTSNSRNTGSAIVISKAATKEFLDPIIRSNNPLVTSLKTDLSATGSAYDVNNNASIYNSIPTWIAEQDNEGQKQIKYLTQIMASYFDSLQLQAEQLNDLRNVDYISGSDKPFPYNHKKLLSSGFIAPDIFIDADILEKLADRSEDLIYDKSLNDIKNIIYQNIYNNLTYIYKSKGTVKAFRNLIRSFGVDDELIKLQMYANNAEYQFRDNRRTVLVNDKLVNFNAETNNQAVVYSFSSSANPNSTGYIPAATQLTGGYAITLEADVSFPTKPTPSANSSYFFTNTLSASLFGVHTARAEETDLTWPSLDATNFQVLAIRDELRSDNAYFKLTGTVGGYVPELTSSLYEDLYTDSTWNLSVRVKPENYPLVGLASGADTGDYSVVFSGVEVRSGEVVNTFTVSGNVASPPAGFVSGSRRIFLGAHRQNTTGAIQQTSDVKINSCRFWLDYVEDQALQQHALDTENHGALRPSLYAFPFDKDATYGEVTKLDTLAFNWEFSENTGSNAAGEFTVADESSGSAALAATRFDWIGEIVNQQVTAQGYGFATSSANAIKKDFIVVSRLNELESIAPAETINVLSAQEQKEFKIDSRPQEFYFSFEKSMSKVISEEMLNTFGTLRDFNNLVGEAVNRYRDEYKALRFMRQRFFEKVSNDEIDFNRFYEFYKWFDSSLSFMLGQLVPASADFSDNVRTIIESHALERSKYQSVFPFIDNESSVFEATALSNVDYGDAISSPDDDMQGTGFYPAHAPTRRSTGLSTRDMVKKWKYVHAPVDGDQKKKYLWWKDEAERDNPSIIETTQVNNSRGSILSSIKQTVAAEDKRPYRFSIAGAKQLGGVGMHQNKNVNFTFQATQPYGPTLSASNIPINIMLSFDIDVESLLDTTDEFYPTYKQRLGFGLNPSINRYDDNRLKTNGGKIAPFSLYETTEQSTFNLGISSSYKAGVTITNLHHDFVADTDIAAQGPFTEKFVGGRYYRHTELNDGSDTRDIRAEGFRLALGLDTASVEVPAGASGALGIVPPNYPFINTPAGTVPLGWVPALPTAQRFRPETAKRPVNIKNILMSTASVGTRLSGVLVHNPIGNYQKNYQVIQTSGRTINDLFFQDQDFAFAPNPETTATRGRFPLTTVSTQNTGGELNFELPDRSGHHSNQTIFVNLFSSPGSYETLSDGYLDTAHEELSVYNALPYRNLGVINRGMSGSNTDPSLTGTIRVQDQLDKPRGLNQLATLHAGRFGYDPVFGSIPSLTYITKPSWHKTNRNPVTRYIQTNASGTPVYALQKAYDNLFVQHALIRSMQQYAWVTASLQSGDTIFGLCRPTAYSASVLDKLIVSGSDDSELTFVGLNTAATDPITASSHFLGFPLTAVASSSYSNNSWLTASGGTSPLDNNADYFNFIITTRNGPFGYPSWKQIRVGESKVARKLRRTNQIGQVVPPPQVPVKLSDGSTYQFVRALSSNEFVDYTEQPVSSRYVPTIINLEDNTTASNPVNNITMKVSYGNNLDFFSHEPLNNRLNIPPPNLFDNSLNSVFSYITSSELSTVIDYGERIYPAEINAYRNSTRRRVRYVIKDFWDADRDSRSLIYGARQTMTGETSDPHPFSFAQEGEGILNSQGVRILSASIWPLDAHLNFQTTQSVLPGMLFAFMDVGVQLSGASTGTGELQNVYSRWAPADNPKFHMQSPSALYAARVPAGSSSAADPLGPAYDSSSFAVYAGDALWEAGIQAGKQPYVDYISYSEKIAVAGKDYSIVPEFRISDLMETYLEEKAGDFLACVDNTFSLTGAAIPGSSEADFFKTYTNSDFLKYFTIVDDALSEKRSGDLKIRREKISLQCNAFLKFLPYKGFYPVERTVELASLLSQSYGPYVVSTVSPTGVRSASRKRNWRITCEPLIAPGILYNTIKSGIAVSNYVLVNTGSDAVTVRDNFNPPAITGATTVLPEGAVKYGIMLNPENNDPAKSNGYMIQPLPFEAIQSPLSYLGPGMVTGSGAFYDTGVDRFHNALEGYAYFDKGLDWIKMNNGTRKYELAIDNFLCATTNFFMNDFASLQSDREDKFKTVQSGSEYFMKVALFRTRTENRATNELEPDRGAFDLYGRESAFGYPLGQGESSASIGAQKACFNHVVPPYYHGVGAAEIKFTAPRTGKPTLDEIFANSEFTYVNEYPESTRLSALDMALSQSVNLTDFYSEVPEGTVEEKKVWLIQSKFETPILNFSNVSYTKPSGSFVAPDLTSSADIKINGMWHQYGSLPTASNDGVFMRIRKGAPVGKLPLADVVGFKTAFDMRVGQPKEAALLEEAVVAIPYKTRQNRRDFFEITKENTNYPRTAENMKKYVFPPKFDFLLHETVKPLLMYVFEFSTALTQTDLTDIWQNLPPTIGESFAQEEVVVAEQELVDALYDASDEIQWMVFKVKKRAKKDFDIVRRQLVSEDTTGITPSIGDYSYNWPYDYFSLVELVKIDETVRYTSGDLE